MCVKINVKVATSSVKYGGFPLKILLILLKMKINKDHFLKLHIFKYHNLIFWLFILTGHILVKTVPSSLVQVMHVITFSRRNGSEHCILLQTFFLAISFNFERNFAPFDFSPLKINHCNYCF